MGYLYTFNFFMKAKKSTGSDKRDDKPKMSEPVHEEVNIKNKAKQNKTKQSNLTAMTSYNYITH